MRLFVERAHQRKPSFELTLGAGGGAGMPEVGGHTASHRVGRRADGGAFSRSSSQKGSKIPSSCLLAAGRPSPRTLRATLEWSHELLSEPERMLFRRLSVFAGGWTLEAAEEVCSGEASSKTTCWTS